MTNFSGFHYDTDSDPVFRFDADSDPDSAYQIVALNLTQFVLRWWRHYPDA